MDGSEFEVMDAEISTGSAELVDGDGELDRLQNRVGRRARMRLRRRGPMTEGQKADVIHEIYVVFVIWK